MKGERGITRVINQNDNVCDVLQKLNIEDYIYLRNIILVHYLLYCTEFYLYKYAL